MCFRNNNSRKRYTIQTALIAMGAMVDFKTRMMMFISVVRG